MSALDGVAKVSRGLCVRGHDLAQHMKVNTYGARICTACRRENDRARLERQKAHAEGRPVAGQFERRPRGMSGRAPSPQQVDTDSRKLPHYVTTVDLWLAEQRRRAGVEARNRLGGTP